MSGRPGLRVFLENLEHRRVTEARVELTRAGERGGIALHFDKERECFVGEAEAVGEYVLIVTASGYNAEMVPLRVEPQGLSTIITLGREDEPHYIVGGRRVYYVSQGGAMGGVVRGAAELRGREGVVTFARDAALRTAEAMPEGVVDYGPLVQRAEDGVQFLSRRIEVIAEDGVTWERLGEVVRAFGLRVVSQNGFDPHLYRVEMDGVPGADYGALPARLAELPEIRRASSIVVAPSEPAGATPADALFPLQFHLQVTRCPEAWDVAGFGSADVIVAVLDFGLFIDTNGGVSVAKHPAFSGSVTGGSLSGKLGSSAKLVAARDFGAGPGIPGNNPSNNPHGSWVAGVIHASADALGTVGIAPNTRLASYVQSGSPASDYGADSLLWMAGLSTSTWMVNDFPFVGGAEVPFLLGSGHTIVPGAAIANNSYTFPGQLVEILEQTLQRVTLFGRDRRGLVIFAAGGNNDKNTRDEGRWADTTNVMRVAASSLDVRDREVRSSYSSYSLPGDEILDFCAPSSSDTVLPAVHEPPGIYKFFSSHSDTIQGDVKDTVGGRGDLTTAAAAGSSSLKVAPGDFGSLSAAQTLIVRDKSNPLHVELLELQGSIAPDTLNLFQGLKFSYTAGAAEVIGLTGAKAYTKEFGGTSAATPQASAVAALMLSVKPSLTWLEVREILRSTAVPIALRYRGTAYLAGPDFRYGWVDPVGTPLVDAQGVLNVGAGAADRLVAAANGPLARGTRILKLNDASGIKPRQALSIGAETKLSGIHQSVVNFINVERSDSFEQGDVIFIGRDVRTTLLRGVLPGADQLVVQSVDGIRHLDEVSVGGELVEAGTIINLKSSASLVDKTDYTEDGAIVVNVTPLAGFHPRGTIVTLGPKSLEGPFTVVSKAPGKLTLDKLVAETHPDGCLVWKEGTELRAVIRVLPGNSVEIDPLGNAHPFNSAGVEHVRVGPVAEYSHGFGRGRIDALEAVKAAKAYTHDERDLMLRGFLSADGKGDDGKTNVGTKEIESPDLWVRNDAQTPGSIEYGEVPHQTPEISVDPAIHIGSGLNDLEVSGTCASAFELTFEIEIEAATGQFQWSRNGAAPTQGVAIGAGAQDLSDGVKIRFASSVGHTAGDRWIVRARQVVKRHLHARVRNRGTLPFFQKSTHVPQVSPHALDVAQCRMLLCVSDGYPVSRFVSVADFTAGPNDLEVIAPYSGGGERSLLTIEIVTASASGDTFHWYRDGVSKADVTLSANSDQTLEGFKIRFGSHTGHKVGDRWNLYARGTDAFLNVDHYWDALPAPAQAPFPREMFDPASGRAGSRVLYAGSVNGLAGGASEIHHVEWPEALRPPTNNPNAPRPAHPRRFFLLGETVPHDGALMGLTPKTNNNVTFREIAFAKFRFAQNNGAAVLDGQIDVDANGIETTRGFRVEVRTTCGTFAAEKVRLRFTAKRGGAQPETRLFRKSGGWGFDGAATWATAAAPLEARRADGTQPAAAGEQFDIAFECTIKVDRSFSEISISAEIVSDFRDHVVVAGTHTVAIVEAAPLPLGTGAAMAAVLPKPRSFVFADTAQLTQSAERAFGPVDGDADNRYRATALFKAAADVKAYAVARGLVAIQRDPANNATVNVILRPLDQPIAGYTPIKYFVYRGIRLADYLKGSSGAAAKLIADPPQLPYLVTVRKTFLAQNPNVTDMPAAVFGYEPDTQTADDPLDEIFFRSGPMQLPVIQAGEELGSFEHGSPFGFEIVVDEGGYAPTIGYARKASYEIDVTSLPSGTPAQNFARRLKQEEILNFLDPAAFYGLHMHKGGVVRAPANVKYEGDDIYTNIVDRFFTKNRLYLDIRSENGSSLNFQGNYAVGGNQLQQGQDPATLAAQSYATDGWPIVLLDQSTWSAALADFNTFYLRLARNDNEEPVLYVAHGQLLTAATDGPFIRGEQLIAAGQPWTNSAGFSIPTKGSNPLKVGVAWILRLFYGRLKPAAPAVPIPDTVLKTAKYTDNVFGPIDAAPKWTGQAAIKWTPTQDDRYVDGPGWRQMMASGLAVDSGTQRVLLYATATARDFVVDPALPVEFAPLRGMPNGVSQKPSFFAEPGLFGVYQLEQDQTHDGATTVRTLRLAQSPARGYAPTSALLLGLTKAEFDTLVALGGGISKDYLRTLLLGDETLIADPDHPATRYSVGVQGLKTADGKYASISSPVQVYSVDGLLFASKAFADAEPLPTDYARNYEEAIGARDWPQRERKIAAVDGNDITIANVDWRDEVHAGSRLNIVKAGAVNATFDVGFVALNGNNTVISLIPDPPAAAASASAFTLTRKVEDRMIDLDQADPILAIPMTRTLVDAFVDALAAIPNDASAKNAIAAKIDDQGAKILDRARALAKNERAHAEVYERVLYWARLRMTVALKSHPLCLASITARDELVERLEKKSRGYDVSFGAVDRKVLLLGLDPFDLHENVERSNPAGAVALALHNQLIAVQGKNAIISSVVLPVRYRDFDAGRVEEIVKPLLTSPGGIAMILSLSENSDPVYDLERIAGRRRLGYYDNERMTRPPAPIGKDGTHKEFYESSLQASQLVIGGSFLTPPDGAQKLFFNQAYTSENKSFDHASDPAATPGANANQPAFTLAGITGKALEGSGGAYVDNEVFYRIARSREELPGSTRPPTGHLAIPTPAAAKVGIAGVIDEVENLIERWLAGAS